MSKATGKARKLVLRFDSSLEDQLLYEALLASAECESRTPLQRQAKHLLGMALGLRTLDGPMLDRFVSTSLRMREGQNPRASGYFEPSSSTGRPKLFLVQ